MKYILAIPLIFLCFYVSAQSAELTEAYLQKTNYLQAKDFVNTEIWGEKMVVLAEKEFGVNSQMYANYAGDLANFYYSVTGDCDKALLLFQKTLRIYETELGKEHEYVATTAFNLAGVYRCLKKVQEAKDLYQRAYTIYEKKLGKDHQYTKMVEQAINDLKKENQTANISASEKLKLIEKEYGKESVDYASALNTMAIKWEEENKTKEAEQAYIESLDIYARVAGKDEGYHTILTNLISLYIKLEADEKAAPRLQESLELSEKLFTEDSENYRIALLNLSEILLNLRKEIEARPLFEERLAYQKKNIRNREDSLMYVILLSNVAEIDRIMADYKMAIAGFEKCLQWMKVLKGENDDDYLLLSNNLAYSYKQLGMFEECESLSLKTVGLYKNKEKINYPNYAVLLNNMGLLYNTLGLYEKSEAAYLESLEISEKEIGLENDSYASTLSNYGLLLFNKGQYEKSTPLFEKSMALKEQLGGRNHPDYANVLIDMGNLNTLQGNYAQAEPFYLEAIRIYENSLGKDHPFYANALNCLAMLYLNIWQPEKSMSLFVQTLKIQEKVLGINHPVYATTLNNFAILWSEIGESEEAATIFKKVMEIRAASLGKESPDYVESLNNLASVYLQMDRMEEAKELYLQILEISARTIGKDHISYAAYLNNMGDYYTKTKDYKQAESYLLQALEIRKKILNKNNVVYNENLANLAYVNTYQKKFEEADKYFDQLNINYSSMIESVFPTLTEFEKGRFFSSIQYYYNLFIEYAIQRYTANPAILGELYNNQLITKALLLSNANQIKRSILSSKDTLIQAIYKEWISQKEYLAKVYTLKDAEVKKRNISINELEKKADDLERELSLKSDFFKQKGKTKSYQWQDLQKTLKEDEAIVEIARYIHLQNPDTVGYVALIITAQTKEHPEIVVFNNANNMEGKYLRNYINSIKKKLEDKISYKQYWQPIKEKLNPNIKKVYFSSDAVYNQINLNSLFNPETQAYLIDELEIQLLTNSKDLLSLNNNIVETKSPNIEAHLFGFPDYDSYSAKKKTNSEYKEFIPKPILNKDTLSRFMNFENLADLEGTKLEVQTIEGILTKNNIKTFTNLQEKATEEEVKSLKNPYILHIATHGFFMDDKAPQTDNLSENYEHEKNLSENPLLRSGLLMVGAKKALDKSLNDSLSTESEDGILTAYEAMNLSLENTELVVLSACETGLGEIKTGEGVYGLQRAFQVAGAKTILMSLWTVSDNATQELMVNFYTNWTKSGNKRMAFQLAQKQLREKYKEPYYWAAFVMLGE